MFSGALPVLTFLLARTNETEKIFRIFECCGEFCDSQDDIMRKVLLRRSGSLSANLGLLTFGLSADEVLRNAEFPTTSSASAVVAGSTSA
jgi:hypothetical protein